MSKFVEANEKIAEKVVEGYKKIEDSVVGGYKKIETGVVEGFGKVTDKCVETLLPKKANLPVMQRKGCPAIRSDKPNGAEEAKRSVCLYLSVKDNAEIEQIRRKYLPQSESKLEELKRLDKTVQESGVIEALTAGIGGMLLAGLGMCLSMQVIANGTAAIVFEVSPL